MKQTSDIQKEYERWLSHAGADADVARELRQMDGEPVWVKADHCGVYADVVHIMGQEDGERYVHFKINWRLQENGYGKTWLAYRHKPREEV